MPSVQYLVCYINMGDGTLCVASSHDTIELAEEYMMKRTNTDCFIMQIFRKVEAKQVPPPTPKLGF